MPEVTIAEQVQQLLTSVSSLASAVAQVDTKVVAAAAAQAELRALLSNVQATLLHVQDVIGTP